MIAGVILAAGASSRMGGSPKALLDYCGETFVERLVRILSGVCNPVIVVLGYHADRIRPAIEGRARIAINPAPERGQLSSLQTALVELPESADGFLFIPVDCPAAERETFERVIAAFRGRDPRIHFVVPQYRGKHGHPVCASREIAAEILALPETAQARDVVHRHVPDTLYVDVDDAGILTDVDDPERYRRLAESAQ
ncbi:MAG TPA: nucleotidyltransferase family protein [Bryobacteraceae bacterium]|nr:nucleotidyltransferase family protein [Bryobacteraceae bacterium]